MWKGHIVTEPKDYNIDTILTTLENAVSQDTALRITQHRSGRSPKSTHAEAVRQIYELITKEIIGEDDKQDWDDDQSFCNMCDFWTEDDSRNCICTFNNALRAEQRQKLTNLFNITQ